LRAVLGWGTGVEVLAIPHLKIEMWGTHFRAELKEAGWGSCWGKSHCAGQETHTTAGLETGATSLLCDEVTGDGVEDTVEKVDGLGGAEAAGDFERLVDDDGEGRGFEADQLGDGHA